MKRLYSLLPALLLTTAVWAQTVKLSDNPEQFLGDLQKLMNTGGPFAQKAEKNLETLFTENRLSAPQKERVIAISRKMNTKRYQAAQQFAPFYETLYHMLVTRQASPPEVDNYLLVVDKSVDGYDARTLAKILETTRLFAEKRQLHATNFNRLYVNGGTAAFRFADASATSASTTDSVKTDQKAQTPAKPAVNDGWDLPLDSAGKAIPIFSAVSRKPIPVLAGPVLDLKGADLVMVTTYDSVVVKKTDGGVQLKDGTFVGKGGTFSWESAGQPETAVTLADYAFSIISARLTADDVVLTFKPLAKPVKGAFEFDSKKRAANQPPVYPRFIAYQNDVVLSNLGNGVAYRGGVALTGTRLYGSAANGQPGMLVVQYKGKPAFKAISRQFEFVDSVIAAPLASFAGYLDAADSLYHPGITFRYNREEGVVRLTRAARTGYSDTYYSDSYHKFYIQPEVVRWDLPRQKVDFYQVGAKKEVPVRFESYDFFHPQRYREMANDYGFQPLQLAAKYVSVKKSPTFYSDDLAQYAKVSPAIMRSVLGRMVMLGFLDMDPQTEAMRLNRKGALYVLANSGQQDYDNFLIRSTYPSNDSTTNATINLRDKMLTIRGVERISISDSLKITAVPSDKIMRVGKNRAFTLNGQMKSGNMRYTGQELAFNYDQFSMNMAKIDSITFTPQGKNQEIGGDIQYEKPGTVFLADKGNKSGQQKNKKSTQRLVMPDGMTVYFNQANRSLAYNKSVYFKVPKVDNDSLGKGDIAFEGTFFSDGIFPPIKTTLKTMPDNSLGFEHTAPAAGYPLYAGKGNLKFTGKLIMDRKGLRAEGVITHANAVLPAKDILMTPDSAIASGESGQIKEGLVGKAYFPAVEIKNYTMKWRPKVDSMKISTKADHFSFYNGTTNLKGDLIVRSTGLFGSGTVKRADSEAQSDKIQFNKEGFTADKAQFRVAAAKLGDQIGGKPMLNGTNVDVDFNQVKGLVTLTTNAPSSITDTLESGLEFPNAGYRTSINKAIWNINAKTIAMKGDVKTSTFTAVAEEQEGLTFKAAAALYEVEKATLNISGVPYVTSADARIYPYNGLVAIRRNGEMLPLKNARLELDTTSLFHKLKNGTIQVQSRTRFSGDAVYQFVAAKGDTANIKMGSFELKEAAPLEASVTTKASRKGKNGGPAPVSYYTVARADVDEVNNVMLAPKVQFKGSITMMAPEQDLKLEGAIKMALKKRKTLISDWIPMKEKIGETFSIKVDPNLKNDGNQPLTAGLHFRGGGGLYPTFLSTKESDRDEDLFNATGTMTYDEKDKVFRIVKKDEGGLDDVEGAFTFDDAKGVMTFKGPLNIIQGGSNGTNPFFAAGSGRANVDSTSLRLNTLLGFGFGVPQPLNAAVAAKIVRANLDEQNSDPADEDLDRLTAKLSALIGQKATDAYRTKAQNQHVSITQAAPKFLASLVLSNVNLRWSEKYNALYSAGPIGVSNLDNIDINAEMEGFVEIRKTAGGDEATIYLEASPEIWFYWDYKPGQLALVTSDQELNDRITAGGKNSGKLALEVVPADVMEKTQFVDRYLDSYKTKEKPKPQPKTVVKKVEKKEEKKKADEKKEGF